MKLTIAQFNALQTRKKWTLYRSIKIGYWACWKCKTENTVKSADLFPGSTVECKKCGSPLTSRTNGGQGDRFDWILTPLKQKPRPNKIIDKK